jgi:apolipoprotein D and lipocalin family protein
MQIVIGFIGVFAIAAFGFMSDNIGAPTVVENVSLDRYMGTWYAVASIPTTFEQDCARGTTATYELLENGKVQVTNTCYREDGSEFQAVGRAWIPNRNEPAKLKVSFVSLFGMWLFPGDYWILELEPNYRYAVVGHPKRRYGWILSRTPTLPEVTLQGIFERLEEAGYSRSQFRRIDQTIPAGS